MGMKSNPIPISMIFIDYNFPRRRIASFAGISIWGQLRVIGRNWARSYLN